MLSLGGRPRLVLFFSLALVFLIFVIISLLVYLSYSSNKKSSEQKITDAFIESVRNEVGSRSGILGIPDSVVRQLSVIKNLDLPYEERYKALSSLAFYFSNEYSVTKDPEIREFSKNVLGKFASEQFPNEYNETMFNFVCADPECGMELSPEIEEALVQINKSSLPEEVKITVSENLTNAGYMLEENSEDKIFGIQLSVRQLETTGNPLASSTAQLLRRYLEKNYKIK